MNRTKYLLENELSQLNTLLTNISKNPKATSAENRDATLLWLLINTGGRATEILNLKFQDLNLNDETVFIKGIKNSNDRELPLPPWLFARLTRSPQAPDSRIFPISYNRLRQIWQLYRPVAKKLHSLRHTFAIRLYSRTKDLRLLKTALGHRSISNTMIYADYLYQREELRKLLLDPGVI